MKPGFNPAFSYGTIVKIIFSRPFKTSNFIEIAEKENLTRRNIANISRT